MSTPSQEFLALVNQAMVQHHITHAAAWVMITNGHRDLATLFGAIGKPADSIRFFNSKIPAAATASKMAARASFLKFVNERMGKGLDYTTAFNACARDHADLWGQMNSVKQEQFANESSGVMPVVFGPALKATFRMPQTATHAEMRAAWHGNGDTIAPFNPGKVFDALAKMIQEREAIAYEAAISRAKISYPELWAAVEQLASQPV